jgi:excisionase family DNA binding protein
MIFNHMQDQLLTDLLDIREAAEFLRVSETSLRRWTNAGQLPCLRIGGRRERRFRRADLLAFMGAADHIATPRRNHFCGLYTSDLGRVDGAAAFLGAGLQSDGLCFLAAEKPVQRAVMAQLEQQGAEVRSTLKAGRLILAKYRGSAAAQIAYWRARMSVALQAGVSHFCVVGDLSTGAFSLMPFAETLAYEADYSRAIANGFSVTTLCQYDVRKLSGVDTVAVLQLHDGPVH